MRVAIFEDEAFAAEHLEKMLLSLEPEMEIAARITTVRKGVEWLRKNSCDLIFMDINLADGLSFKIFEAVEVKTPVIFTTAYDQYAIKAFEVNSVDYLLKPIPVEKLRRSLEKFREYNTPTKQSIDIQTLLSSLSNPGQSLRERFTVEAGEKINVIPVTDIAYFFAMNKATFFRTKSNKTYPVDYSLDKLSDMLNPKHFFRVNRAYIVHLESIANMNLMGTRSIKLTLNPPSDDMVLVSNSRYSEFKEWLNL